MTSCAYWEPWKIKFPYDIFSGNLCLFRLFSVFVFFMFRSYLWQDQINSPHTYFTSVYNWFDVETTSLKRPKRSIDVVTTFRQFVRIFSFYTLFSITLKSSFFSSYREWTTVAHFITYYGNDNFGAGNEILRDLENVRPVQTFEFRVFEFSSIRDIEYLRCRSVLSYQVF